MALFALISMWSSAQDCLVSMYGQHVNVSLCCQRTALKSWKQPIVESGKARTLWPALQRHLETYFGMHSHEACRAKSKECKLQHCSELKAQVCRPQQLATVLSAWSCKAESRRGNSAQYASEEKRACARRRIAESASCRWATYEGSPA